MIEAKLARAMAQHSDTPFEYGVHDCAKFANALILAVHGRDLLAESGLFWSSPREAVALRRALGAGKMAAAVTAVLGEPIEIRQARVGDLVVADCSPWQRARPSWAVGVHTGARAVFAARPRGWVSLDLSRCSHAWRVD